MYGAAHPTEADTLNRGLKALVSERMQIVADQVFGGQAGVTVIIPTPMIGVGYMVIIKPREMGGFIGQITVASQALNSFVVYNSGSDIVTLFDAMVIDLS